MNRIKVSQKYFILLWRQNHCRRYTVYVASKATHLWYLAFFCFAEKKCMYRLGHPEILFFFILKRNLDQSIKKKKKLIVKKEALVLSMYLQIIAQNDFIQILPKIYRYAAVNITFWMPIP